MDYSVRIVDSNENYIVSEDKLFELFNDYINLSICKMKSLSRVILYSDRYGQVIIRKVGVNSEIGV